MSSLRKHFISIYLMALVLLVSACTQSQSPTGLNLLPQSKNRGIINGTSLAEANYPNIRAIGRDLGDGKGIIGICSATLIAARWVLTSSACVYKDGTTELIPVLWWNVKTAPTATGYTVSYAGAIKAQKVFAHPLAQKNGDGVDVALVLLPNDVSAGPFYTISDSLPVINSQVTLYGFGKYTPTGGMGTLRSGEMKVSTTYPLSFFFGPSDRGVLSLSPLTTSNQVSHQGDAGGPILQNGSLVGITVRGNLKDSTYGIATSAVSQWIRTYIDGSDYVRKLSRDMLRRPADTNIISSISNQIRTTGDLLGAATSVMNTNEARGQLVNDIYLRLLDRPADPAGQAWWVGRLAAGDTEDVIMSNFAATNEYFAQAGGTNFGLVQKIYRDFLFRESDSGGLTYWVQQLNNGVSRYSVAYGLTQSEEYRRNIIKGDYIIYLGRTADSGGLHYWIGKNLRHEQRLASFAAGYEYITSPAPSQSNSAPALPQGSQVVFVTSTPYAANVGGPPIADFICNRHAMNSNLGRGRWKAIISSEVVNARDRIKFTNSVVNTTGESVASSNPFNSRPQQAIKFTESGTALNGRQVWTGTNTDGTRTTGYTCSSWTVAGNATATWGLDDYINNSWIIDGLYPPTKSCGGTASFYCISNQ